MLIYQNNLCVYKKKLYDESLRIDENLCVFTMMKVFVSNKKISYDLHHKLINIDNSKIKKILYENQSIDLSKIKLQNENRNRSAANKKWQSFKLKDAHLIRMGGY